MKTIIPFVFAVLFLFSSCSSSKKTTSSSNESTENIEPTEHALFNEITFLLTEVSTDKKYGYSEENPIKVGGLDKSGGPKEERKFLNALTGPNGEDVTYNRINSCCHFESERGMFGMGLLDVYEVKWVGLKKPKILYINMYDYGQLKAPYGFGFKKK